MPSLFVNYWPTIKFQPHLDRGCSTSLMLSNFLLVNNHLTCNGLEILMSYLFCFLYRLEWC